MAVNQGGDPPEHDVHYTISDEDARKFLWDLAEDGNDLRTRLERNPRETLLEAGIDITGIPETVELPPAETIRGFLETYESGESRTDNVGYAILYMMLGAMPLVVADRDGAA